ncbi:MAG: AI-2E family transporter [Salibaculum sp.]|jgi:predicted PurR-regulated permease PerM|uniref:AI-2E family transporter n=1 Tax=Roseovarius halophilus (ex Wu et al. 2025) TaxID=3376060 RepID=UPI002870780C|nr:AI-2E family transporter [Salibaculum sp.]MDR9427050.1 AI-2E family transporter [Salibaculum sp.]MDR9481951.1 AI-2E family transporter [Salibaculum sp.]
MALAPREQVRYWSIATVVFIAILWFLGDVLLPFVLGGAVAYCLDPVADRLQRAGLSRIAATILITLVGVLIFVVGLLLILPSLINQAGQLIQQIGQLIQNAPQLFNRFETWLSGRFPAIDLDSDAIRKQLGNLGNAVQASGGTVLNSILSSAVNLINILVLIVIVPVVTFYLLMDWDRMVARIDELLPRDHAPTVRKLAAEIDGTLASFIRGQGTVCLVLGTYYAVALMLAGLNYGLIIGFVAGLISFIPYVGALVGGVLAIGVALIQWWSGTETVDGETIQTGIDWLRIAIVAAIFMLGQFFEGNILTPNLVGQSVGLHPVWLILALSIFGSLFGFVGMLVAVPVAAMLGVVARFLIAEYKSGRLYRGLSDPGE